MRHVSRSWKSFSRQSTNWSSYIDCINGSYYRDSMIQFFVSQRRRGRHARKWKHWEDNEMISRDIRRNSLTQQTIRRYNQRGRIAWRSRHVWSIRFILTRMQVKRDMHWGTRIAREEKVYNPWDRLIMCTNIRQQDQYDEMPSPFFRRRVKFELTMTMKRNSIQETRTLQGQTCPIAGTLYHFILTFSWYRRNKWHYVHPFIIHQTCTSRRPWSRKSDRWNNLIQYMRIFKYMNSISSSNILLTITKIMKKMSRRHGSLLHFYIRRTKYLHNLQVFLSRVNRIIVNTQEKCRFSIITMILYLKNDWNVSRKIVIVSWKYIDVSREHVPCFGIRWISLRYSPSTVSEYIISIDHTIDDSVALAVSACIRMTVYERFITSVTSDVLRSHTFQKYDYPSRRSRLVWREDTMSILR